MIELSIHLPDSYFEEEVRSGFPVTRERKELWAVELDMLVQLDRVCKAHDLRYMLGAGTLLGAVRHKGFIPWDDDIDVYMLRDDYDKLIAMEDAFQKPYFLQNAHTDKHSIRTHSRLRNTNTTGYSKKEAGLELNKGLFIDIFPLDGVSENSWKNAVQKLVNKGCRGLLKHYLKYSRGISALSFRKKITSCFSALMIAIFGKEFFCRWMEKNLSRYSRPETKIWGNRTLVFDCPLSRRPLEDYTNLIMGEFEGYQFPIPANYDAMLTQQYGDYMKIPEVKPGSMHGKLIVSTSISYKDYSPARERTD